MAKNYNINVRVKTKTSRGRRLRPFNFRKKLGHFPEVSNWENRLKDPTELEEIYSLYEKVGFDEGKLDRALALL